MKELEGQRRWEKYPRKCRKIRLKWYGHVLRRKRRIRREESDGDGGAGEKKERTTKEEVVG